MSNRSKTNFYIDLAMFVILGALIGIGVLIKYVLISGQERWLVFGQNIELTFWGMDRHQWGTLHLILGGVFFVLFVLHLVFHWNMIKCLFRKCVSPVSWRRTLSVLSVVLFILFAGFPLLVTPDQGGAERGRNMLEDMGVDLNDSIRIRLKKPKSLEEGGLEMELERKNQKEEIDIRGSMTLRQVSNQFDVELSVLKKELNLPAYVSPDDRLGILRKEHGFTMGDVKTVVLKQEMSER